MNHAQAALEYTQGVGFPDAQLYGEDGGIYWNAPPYNGSLPEPTAKSECVGYCQANGFPNAVQNDTGIVFNP